MFAQPGCTSHDKPVMSQQGLGPLRPSSLSRCVAPAAMHWSVAVLAGLKVVQLHGECCSLASLKVV